MLSRYICSETSHLDKLTDDKISSFKSSLIPQLSTVSVLRLRDFTAGDSALKVLAGLINLEKLTDFTLTGSKIGDESAVELAQALNGNLHLTNLNFGGFNVSDEGLLALGRSIRRHPSLEEFCIVCGPSISDTALIDFALNVEKNLHWSKRNMHGVIFSPKRISQAMLIFLNDFFDKVVQRNLSIREELKIETKIMLYDAFVNKWNDELVKRKDLPFAVEPFMLKPWPQPKSLVEICFFNVKKYRNKNALDDKVKLPADLEERLFKMG